MMYKIVSPEECILDIEGYTAFNEYLMDNPDVIQGHVVEYLKGKDEFKITLGARSSSTVYDILFAVQQN